MFESYTTQLMLISWTVATPGACVSEIKEFKIYKNGNSAKFFSYAVIDKDFEELSTFFFK